MTFSYISLIYKKKYTLLLASLLISILTNGQTINWEKALYGPSEGHDEGNDITIDSQGNAIVTGYSEITNKNCFVAKYDTAGNLIWSQTYSSTLASKDIGVSVAVDNSDNIYVAGITDSTSSSLDDAMVLMYSSSGVLKWSLAIDSIYSVTKIIVDSSNNNNIYVAGDKFGSPLSSFNCFLAKIDSSGNLQWVVDYDGGFSSEEICKDLNIDSQGNAYLVGSQNDAVAKRCLLLKYNSNGGLAWKRNYGLVNTNFFNSVAIGSKHIYVCGSHRYTTDSSHTLLAKYDTSGDLSYTRQYRGTYNGHFDFGKRITLDGSENIYIGCQQTIPTPQLASDIVLVKYDSTGNFKWDYYYGAPQFSDAISDMVTDQSGNTYISGVSVVGTSIPYNISYIKINTTGNQVFSRLYDNRFQSDDVSHAIAIDKNGKAVITGYQINDFNNKDASVIWYDASGNFEQSNVFYERPSPTSKVRCYDAIIDNSDNIYSVGVIKNYLFISKHNEYGDEQWINYLDFEPSLTSYAAKVKIYNDTTIYISSLYKNNGEQKLALLSYNSSGKQNWMKKESRVILAADMLIDTIGNIYLCGFIDNKTATSEDAYVAKYNSSGTKQWEDFINDTTVSRDSYYELAFDSIGNILVAGSNRISTDRILYANYNSNTGARLWLRKKTCRFNYKLVNLVIDQESNLYTLGLKTDYYTGAVGQKVTIEKYGNALNLLWIDTLDYRTLIPDDTRFFVIDNQNNLYIAYSKYDSASGTYGALAKKYNSSGNQIWTSSLVLNYIATTITLHNNNNVFIACPVNDTSKFIGTRPGIVKLELTNGNFLWKTTFDDTSGYFANGAAIKILVNSKDQVHLPFSYTPNILGVDHGSVRIVQYSNPTITSIEPFSNKAINQIVAYPNPLRESILYLKGPLNEGFIFTLYDISGRELYHRQVFSNEVDLTTLKLSAGTFIYRVRSTNTETLHWGKLIKL